MSSATPTIVPGGDRILPTRGLTWQEFEEFIERLLSAHRFCTGQVRHVSRVQRWGRPGDTQDGIDFEGAWSDGTTAAWQCKRQRTLGNADIDEIVAKCTFEADHYYLTFSDAASSTAKAHIKKHLGWDILDRDGLQTMLDDLPLHRQRQVLDKTWGKTLRKKLLRSPGEDAFLLVEDARALRAEPELLNDNAPLVGRTNEIAQLVDDVISAGIRAAVVSGPGGRGKSRVLLEALARADGSRTDMPVLYAAPGRTIDADAIDELPYSPAVIAIDDAHMSLPGVSLLYTYALAVPGTRIILTSRESYVEDLLAGLAKSGLDTVTRISLHPLERRHARELVESLSTGIDLSYVFKSRLAGEATHSPHIVVLALNLVRLGKLSGSLEQSPDLRGAVMNRYREIQTESIGGCPALTVRRTLGTYAALGPLAEDEHIPLLGQIAEFCGLQKVELLQLLQDCTERGVLLRTESTIQVIPELLADQLVEQQAVIAGFDTDFVSEIWENFKFVHPRRLLRKLAELDHRLTDGGAPSVLERPWLEIYEDVLGSDREGVVHALGRLDAFCHAQPGRMIGLAHAVQEKMRNVGFTDVPPAARGPLTFDALGRSSRSRLGIGNCTDQDVEDQLATLYGLSARADAQFLEDALDGLWQVVLGRGPTAEVPRSVETSVREIANLGTLSDPTVSLRTISRVRTWIENSAGSVGADPTFPIAPLLVKEGTRTVQTSALEVSIHSYNVSPQATRNFRDAAREVFLTLGASPHIADVGRALPRLHSMLRQPHGHFGSQVPDTTILGWEDDDLATITVLKSIGSHTDSPAVRRRIRDILAWPAERAKSMPVRYAALSVLTKLDHLPQDDFAELILNEYRFSIPSQRGNTVPSYEQYCHNTQTALSSTIDNSMTRDGQAYDRRQTYTADLLSRTVRSTYEEYGLEMLFDHLISTANDIAQLQPSKQVNLWSTFRYMADEFPYSAAAFAKAIVSRTPSALDPHLGIILEAWSHNDENRLLEWLASIGAQPSTVRLSVARTFDNYGWVARGARYLELYESGLTDIDGEVRQTYVRSIHPLIRISPHDAVQRLLDPDFTQESASHVVQMVCGTDGHSWSATLAVEDASAVLKLCEQAGLDSWESDQLVSGVAETHPVLVLEHLHVAFVRDQLLILQFDDVVKIMSKHPDKVATWAIYSCSSHIRREKSAALRAALGSDMSGDQAAAIERVARRAGAVELASLLQTLGKMDLWPIQHPQLAQALLERADSLGTSLSQIALLSIESALTLGNVLWENGVSEEVDSAIALAEAANEGALDPRLRSLIESVARQFKQEANSIAKRYQDEIEL